MRSFRVLVLGLAAVIVLGATFWGRNAVFGGKNPSAADLGALEAENAGLKAQLANILRFKNATGTPVFGGGRYDYFPAEVQSDYPFNDYAAVTIGAGTADGLKPGMPVLAEGGILLGKIKSAAGTQSEVQTIFDPAWRSAVAVGSSRTKAVLVGGASPNLDLLPKDAGVGSGDGVLSIATGLPPDLLVGQVAVTSQTSAGLWAKATLALPWNPGVLDRVYVITNFP